jgi:hypothetical protein
MVCDYVDGRDFPDTAGRAGVSGSAAVAYLASAYARRDVTYEKRAHLIHVLRGLTRAPHRFDYM